MTGLNSETRSKVINRDYLIPSVLTDILTRCAEVRRSMSVEAARAEVPACDCGHNPYRAFFAAAEQALTQCAVLIQGAQPLHLRQARDVAVLVYAVRCAARSEIDAFCGACQHRGSAGRCRFAVAES